MCGCIRNIQLTELTPDLPAGKSKGIFQIKKYIFYLLIFIDFEMHSVGSWWGGWW